MAVPFAQIDKTAHDEMSCTFAALILYDEGLEISSEKINKLIAASGNKVDAYWPGLFARALQGKNVAELLLGGSGGAATGGAKPAAAEGTIKGFSIFAFFSLPSFSLSSSLT